MYKNILVPIENSPTDLCILEHVQKLAKLTNARLILMHVADGWVARNFDKIGLRESEEMKKDFEYLETTANKLKDAGFEVEHVLALGDPATQIIKLSKDSNVDLIAMATHGHRFFGDLLHGHTADKVRHQVEIPVLLLKSPIN